METRRVVLLGLFIAIAGVLHAVENWIPLPIPVPGAKLGLANIISLFVITLYGWRDAIIVAVLRVLLGSLLSGVFLGPAFIMAMSGAVMSAIVMAYVSQAWGSTFSLIGISVIGAAVHNVTQITVAAMLVASIGVYWYLPYLILLSLPTGVATGFTGVFFLSKLPSSVRE